MREHSVYTYSNIFERWTLLASFTCGYTYAVEAARAHKARYPHTPIKMVFPDGTATIWR